MEKLLEGELYGEWQELCPMPFTLRDSSCWHRAGALPLALSDSSMVTTRLACGEKGMMEGGGKLASDEGKW